MATKSRKKGRSTRASGSSGSSFRALVVDDAEGIRSYLVNLLELKGYEVDTAEDGRRALGLLEGGAAPDVVILDVMMPGKNGWEVAKELRHDARFAKTGIIMLTAIGEKINEMTSPLYGADGFIDKPFEFADLEAKISEVLAKRKASS
jgi:DNA-binding response OmpR family regulator